MTNASVHEIKFQYDGWTYVTYLNDDGFLEVVDTDDSEYNDEVSTEASWKYESAVQFAIDELEPMLKRFAS